MNSTSIGNEFEDRIYCFFKKEIDSGQFWAKPESCKLFRKKGYHSKDREALIIFDVSVEIFLPGSEEYSCLVLFECKNYTHSVPVNDVEEFFQKVQQVGAANSKSVLASNAAFQSGTRTFAKSKGIGLFRYRDPSCCKWELKRSFAESLRVKMIDPIDLVEQGLSEPALTNEVFSFYFQSPVRVTNSLYDFFEDLVIDNGFTSSLLSKVINQHNHLSSRVQYLEKNELEERCGKFLRDINYQSGEVSLDLICANERDRCGLQVIFDTPLSNAKGWKPVLGCINFYPLQINIYAQKIPIHGRERFTLAHELAHHLLQHDQYMVRETCDEGDFILPSQTLQGESDISRMEFQANYFAACLLMPGQNFVAEFHRILRLLDIPDKGFGALYVDNQPCNFHNCNLVISNLMHHYGVSRAAAKIRLEGFGLLRDTRVNMASSSSHSIFKGVFGEELFD